jgi:glycolate oxidase iron-sulfur subunit
MQRRVDAYESTLRNQFAAMALKGRKVAAIRASGAGAVATANIGCQIHLADAAQVPVLHLVQLLDWATGGPAPSQIDDKSAAE